MLLGSTILRMQGLSSYPGQSLIPYVEGVKGWGVTSLRTSPFDYCRRSKLEIIPRLPLPISYVQVLT